MFESTSAPAPTQQRILDAAERLLIERGIAATTLRAVTSQAGVNLAAVNYHFGTKEALVQAVFHRHLSPINEARLARLDALEDEGGTPSLEGVARAFLEPAFSLWRSGGGRPVLARLMARAFVEAGPQTLRLRQALFQRIQRRFLRALGRAAPHLDQEELHWRFHFVVGAMSFAAHGHERARQLDPEQEAGVELERVPAYLLHHFVATFAAEATPDREQPCES